jgi:hypothetical protein
MIYLQVRMNGNSTTPILEPPNKASATADLYER